MAMATTEILPRYVFICLSTVNLQAELSLFVLVAVTVRFLWKQKVTTGESFFKIKALLPLF